MLDVDSPELTENLADLQIVRLVGEWDDTREVAHGEIEIAGSLGAQILVWEYATAVAGRILGINPFDQPDVESAKIATRALIDNPSQPAEPAFVVPGPNGADIEVRGTANVVANTTDLGGALFALLSQLPEDGYVSIQAYVDRVAHPGLVALRDEIAARSKRPVTFGWGPRFLHSTGQFNKGGPAVGVLLQILTDGETDLQIPDRPFTFGQLIRAQAQGDASVLAEHGRPVLSLTLRDAAASLPVVINALK